MSPIYISIFILILILILSIGINWLWQRRQDLLFQRRHAPSVTHIPEVVGSFDQDEMTEIVYEIIFHQLLSGERLLSCLQHHHINKFVRYIAINQKGQEVLQISNTSTYQKLNLFITKVSRHGYINKITTSHINVLLDRIVALCDNAEVIYPQMEHFNQDVQVLYDLCEQFKYNITVQLLLPKPQQVRDLTDKAMAFGFLRQQDHLVYLDKRGYKLLTMQLSNVNNPYVEVDHVALDLDFMCYPQTRNIFSKMMDVATAFAASLGDQVRVVDVNHNDITKEGIDLLDNDLQFMTEKATDCGLQPGSDRCLRIFSQ